MPKPVATLTSLFDSSQYVPACVGEILNQQTDLPRIAKDKRLIAEIETKLEQIPTRHDLYRTNSTAIEFLAPGSIELVVTSPPIGR